MRLIIRRTAFPCLVVLLFLVSALPAAEPAKVYVILWFDTEDYLLPASDDAALHLAKFLTGEQIRATFKVVGEKARTLERRGRTDVINALKKHEIGYHSNYHSTQPSPAMYLSPLGWDEGVAEFDRRERPGFDDLKRIFGVAPSCYGQPGSSWGPQSYGAMRKWGMPVYLDSGSHVNLNDRPCYYCGILNLYRLAHTLRADLKDAGKLPEAEDRFLDARKKLAAEGGGVVSIYYHPCEFVHQEFWDAVNFRAGANPPREQWKRPPQKSPEESRTAFDIFERYVRFMKRFTDVRFITASEAARLYRDGVRGKTFSPEEIRELARGVRDEVSFSKVSEGYLTPAELFCLLNQFLLSWSQEGQARSTRLDLAPFGPSESSPEMRALVQADWSQLTRSAADVADSLRRHGRIPTAVWLGSKAVPPESYLIGLARVVGELGVARPHPDLVEFRPARLATARNVAEDNLRLWGWIIFPPGFRAPEMMALAKRQAWTLKPAVLGADKETRHGGRGD